MNNKKKALYARRRTVNSLEDCRFYHAIDLPEDGSVPGDWDLRGAAGSYLGNYDFKGKRVIDVGAASGFLSFDMEKRGAEVVSFDMANGRQWDYVPFPEYVADLDTNLAKLEKGARKIRNSYWYSHKALKSKNCFHEGNIYTPLPSDLGQFHVAVFGMIFTHLRDPIRALASILPSVTKTVILTNSFLQSEKPIASFVPSRENHIKHAFWVPSVACVSQMLGIFGFELDRAVDSQVTCKFYDPQETGVTAIVASRR